MLLPFTDVSWDHWAYSAVKRVYTRGLMVGVSDTSFAPGQTLSRAMLASILYRLAGEPAVTAENPFTDVPADQWYTDAVIWRPKTASSSAAATARPASRTRRPRARRRRSCCMHMQTLPDAIRRSARTCPRLRTRRMSRPGRWRRCSGKRRAAHPRS